MTCVKKALKAAALPDLTLPRHAAPVSCIAAGPPDNLREKTVARLPGDDGSPCPRDELPGQRPGH